MEEDTILDPNKSQLLIDYDNPYTVTEHHKRLAELMDGDACWIGYDPDDLRLLLEHPESSDAMEAYRDIIEDAVYVDGNGLEWHLTEHNSALFLVRMSPTDTEMEGIS